jgi:LysR family glycine cleavage system transcriptional activator
MRSALPPLNWLRAFEATARHLSFTSAAGELGLTQAAVSKQVKLLEEHLSSRLFIRHPRSLEITRVGQSYLPIVAQAFERIASGTGQLFVRGDHDVLTVRTSIGFGALWLAPRLEGFRKQHPDIPLRIISNVWQEDDLKGRCDLDIHYGTGGWQDRDSIQLTQDELFPVCHPDLPVRSLENLRSETLIEVLGYREGWPEWLSRVGWPLDTATTCLAADTTNMAFAMMKRATDYLHL